MSGPAKAIIIIAATFFFLIIVGVGVAAYWWSHHGPALLENATKGIEDAEKFGKTTDNNGCVKEGVSRYKKKPGITSAISNGVFIQGCLMESTPTPGFCDNVPSPFSPLKSAQWQAQMCKEAGLNDSMCPQLFAQVQQYCFNPNLHRKFPNEQPGAVPSATVPVMPGPPPPPPPPARSRVAETTDN